jgi:alpha/beta superfamily hydrolase
MRFTLPILSLLLVFSCASSEPAKNGNDTVQQSQTVKTEFKKGGFTDAIVAGDPSNSYTVYLPASYDTTKKYPVVIFFDAHANGKLPLNNYKALAEKWGYILVGSNTSKNGLASDYTMNIGNELINEVKKTLSVDEKEIIVCGFSGGARVASNIAMTRNDLRGLICNSAAPQAPLAGKIFIGLAGLGDMNYLEMKKFVDNQQSNTSPHELLVFDGKHEWAPATMMEDALLISGITPINGICNPNTFEMYRALGGLIMMQADSIKKTSCLISNNLLQTGKRAQDAAFQHGDVRVKSDDSTIGNIKIDPCVKSDEAAWKAAEAQETVLQQELANALMSKDTTWWKQNADHYFESKIEGADKFMHQRLRGYASLMCYSYANQAFKVNNLHAAEKFVAIYAIVDPTNSEWAYMRANLYMQIGLNDYALSALEKAAELGFNDRTRLQNDPVFAPVRSDARFAALIGKMN